MRIALLRPLAACLALAAAVPAWSAAPVDPLLDRPLPQFSLPSPGGRQPGLASGDFLGQPHLLNIFASWCSGCGEEIEMLDNARREGAVIYGLDWSDTLEDTQAFFRDYGNPFARIGNSADGALVAKLGITLAPQTLVVDGQGVVRYHLQGLVTEEIWRETLQPLLARLAAEK